MIALTEVTDEMEKAWFANQLKCIVCRLQFSSWQFAEDALSAVIWSSGLHSDKARGFWEDAPR